MPTAIPLVIGFCVLLIIALIIILCCTPGNNANNATPELARYRARAFLGGVTQEFDCTSYYTGNGRMYLCQVGHNESTIVSGTIIVEPTAPPKPDTNDVPRYRLALFDHSGPVFQADIVSYSTGDGGRIYFYRVGDQESSVIMGHCLIEPIVAGAAPRVLTRPVGSQQ